MKISIEISVDDFTGDNYELLSADNKEKLEEEIVQAVKKTVNNDRTIKLKKLLEEIQKESGASELDPEVLYELFRGEIEH